MLFAANHTEALNHLLNQHADDLEDIGAPISVDAWTDALFLVPLGENTCGDSYTGIAGPGGEWADGRDDGAELPPWFGSSEFCTAPI